MSDQATMMIVLSTLSPEFFFTASHCWVVSKYRKKDHSCWARQE
jgi:hypothetical protein